MMGLKEIAENIKTMRMSRNMTQRDLAKALGVSSSTIAMYETARREPNIETMEALADTFNVPLSSITGNNKPTLPPGLIPISDLQRHRIPVLGSMAAGEPIYDEEFPDVVVDGPLDADFALRVHGDSMQPGYLDGDLVFLRSVPDVPHNGSVCAVSVDNEAALKHVFRYSDHVLLTSDNQQYEPMQYSFAEHDIRILGVPVGFLRMYK